MDTCTNALIFRGKGQKSFFQHTYCEGRYEACEIYRMLMREKYPEVQ